MESRVKLFELPIHSTIVVFQSGQFFTHEAVKGQETSEPTESTTNE